MSFYLQRLLIFISIYLALPKTNLFDLVIIIVICLLSLSIARKISENINVGGKISSLSFLILLPLILPIDLQNEILPYGYKYIAISLVASILSISLKKREIKNIPQTLIAINFLSAAIAPFTYISGPSASFDELNTENENQYALPNIASITKKNISLASSGFFKLSFGSLLSQVNPIIEEGIISFSLLTINGLVYLLIYGFFNFWKFYLLFSGASELCKSFLLLLNINVLDNFNNPEEAIHYHEIWGRWHLNITERVKKYLYTPITLFALRNFSKFNSLIKFLAIEGMPAASLFIIIGIWHGGRKVDFLFAIISTFLTIASRSLSKTKLCSNLIQSSRIFKESYRFTSLSIFGIALSLYSINSMNNTNRIFLENRYKEIGLFFLISVLLSFYYKFKPKFKFLQVNCFDKSLKNYKFFIFIILEILVALFIQIRFLLGSYQSNNFMYFAN